MAFHAVKITINVMNINDLAQILRKALGLAHSLQYVLAAAAKPQTR
jgi:hypothetical protein